MPNAVDSIDVPSKILPANITDGVARNSVYVGKLRETPMRYFCSADLSYLRCIELKITDDDRAAFPVAITIVVSQRAQKHMRRVDAGCNIAMMANAHAFGNRTVQPLIGKAVSQALLLDPYWGQIAHDRIAAPGLTKASNRSPSPGYTNHQKFA